MLALPKRRETAAQWQRAAELLLDGADVADFSKAVELALFYDAKLDVSKVPAKRGRHMDKDYLVPSRSSGEWNDDDYDVLADGAVVGRILKVHAAPVGSPWMWTLAFGQHEDRTPTHGYAATREAAMTAFAKSWRRG
jgi:hypothetical protein